MTPHEVATCPLCGEQAVTLPVSSARGRAYACNPCRGIFIVSDEALVRYAKFDAPVRDAAREIFAGGGWARIEMSWHGVTTTRVPGSGEGRGPNYFDGQMARLTGLSDSANPNEVGNKAYLDWYDGWASIGRNYG